MCAGDLLVPCFGQPWAGDVYRHPEFLIPGVADAKNLAPLYASLHDTIRAIDDQHTIFFEPVTIFSDLPFGNLTTTGLTQGPGGPAYNDRQVS